mmetsp:Transcript_9286/g.18047  ORF Transcript_9286/g.18047 Transcript_9286/m.18047 type:complete len:247 (+) Transcript_9286:984-1724(+)
MSSRGRGTAGTDTLFFPEEEAFAVLIMSVTSVKISAALRQSLSLKSWGLGAGTFSSQKSNGHTSSFSGSGNSQLRPTKSSWAAFHAGRTVAQRWISSSVLLMRSRFAAECLSRFTKVFPCGLRTLFGRVFTTADARAASLMKSLRNCGAFFARMSRRLSACTAVASLPPTTSLRSVRSALHPSRGVEFTRSQIVMASTMLTEGTTLASLPAVVFFEFTPAAALSWALKRKSSSRKLLGRREREAVF